MISSITTNRVQNTSFGAVKANLEVAKELVSGTPFLTAYSAAEKIKLAARKSGDRVTVYQADSFQRNIQQSGVDSVFTEGESDTVDSFVRMCGDNQIPNLHFVAETHEDAHTLPEDKIAAAVLEKSSYDKVSDMVQVINRLLYGE